MGINVAELKYSFRWKRNYRHTVFNEMEDTNEITNLRKLADVWMSKNRCCLSGTSQQKRCQRQSNHC